MAISVFEAAKFACQSSGWTLTNLQLQKLLYLSHLFYLGRKDEPLISNDFEAWDYGPVQPDLYHHAKVYGSSPVKNIFKSFNDLKDGTEKDQIEEIVASYKNHSPSWLVGVTHWEKGAWARNYEPGVMGCWIPNTHIKQEYMDRIDAARERRSA